MDAWCLVQLYSGRGNQCMTLGRVVNELGMLRAGTAAVLMPHGNVHNFVDATLLANGSFKCM